MIIVDNKSKCCGCTACESICPYGAISMQADNIGFVYPQVDKVNCVDCGLCERVCAFNSIDISQSDRYPIAYAARHKDIEEVENSRSGAVFVALSDVILNEKGVVYGAALTERFVVVHRRATNMHERDALRGSKYVQSDLNGIFKQVREDLKEGITVLFSGTPCQVAGLKSYLNLLKIDMRNLLLVDVVCHGVPSPSYWQDYLSYIESKENSDIVKVNFRDKRKFGWSSHRESFQFSNGKTKSYNHNFYHDIMLRRSCGVCPYANIKRVSDITIGDFWGWENLGLSINNDNKGVNLVLINTNKGESLLNKVKDNDVECYPVGIDQSLQPNLLKPTNTHPLQGKFEADYIRRGFEYVGKKYTDLGWQWQWRRFKGTVKKILMK